jgi:hypothetical protein
MKRGVELVIVFRCQRLNRRKKMKNAIFPLLVISLVVFVFLACFTTVLEPKDPLSRLILEGRRRTERGEIHWERVNNNGTEFLQATIDNRKIMTDLWNVWGFDQQTEKWILLEEANARSYDFGLAALAYVEKKEQEVKDKQAKDYFSRN